MSKRMIMKRMWWIRMSRRLRVKTRRTWMSVRRAGRWKICMAWIGGSTITTLWAPEQEKNHIAASKSFEDEKAVKADKMRKETHQDSSRTGDVGRETHGARIENLLYEDAYEEAYPDPSTS